MDTPAPASIDDQDLSGVLAEGWGLTDAVVRYVPKGAGSFHWLAESGGERYFITVDDLHSKPWIADRPDPTFAGLTRAYSATWALQHRAGLHRVVGPIRSRNGSVLMRLSDRYSLAVFPFVEGAAGDWGDPLDDQLKEELIRELARLHLASSGGLGLTPRPLVIPRRTTLEAGLSELDRPWVGGPLSEPARQALAVHGENVRQWLGELDLLADRLRAEQKARVVTHGEPHPGNLIYSRSGLRLIDWDTVAMAPPERDLWMLDDGSPGNLHLYEHLTRTMISPTALRFFAVAWTLSDIALFCELFRSTHAGTRWLQQKFDGFQRLLGGEQSAPYSQL